MKKLPQKMEKTERVQKTEKRELAQRKVEVKAMGHLESEVKG